MPRPLKPLAFFRGPVRPTGLHEMRVSAIIVKRCDGFVVRRCLQRLRALLFKLALAGAGARATTRRGGESGVIALAAADNILLYLVRRWMVRVCPTFA